MSRPTSITLAILSRDHGATIGRTINSARAFVDQVVVRDIGSVDDTVAVAQAAGALVIRGTSHDDFAAARNLLLTACRTSWILSLEADERLLTGGEQIQRLVRRPRVDGFTVDIRGPVGFGQFDTGRSVRLFRRLYDTRYQFRLGELLHGVPRVEPSCVHLEHGGGVGPGRLGAIANLALLDRDLAELPSHPYLHWRRARELDLLGRRDEAKGALAAAATALHALSPPALAAAGFAVELLADWVATLAPNDELATAVPLAARVVQAAPDRPLPRFLHAQALVAAGRPDDAVQAARALLQARSWRFELPAEERLLTVEAPAFLATHSGQSGARVGRRRLGAMAVPVAAAESAPAEQPSLVGAFGGSRDVP